MVTASGFIALQFSFCLSLLSLSTFFFIYFIYFLFFFKSQLRPLVRLHSLNLRSKRMFKLQLGAAHTKCFILHASIQMQNSWFVYLNILLFSLLRALKIYPQYSESHCWGNVTPRFGTHKYLLWGLRTCFELLGLTCSREYWLGIKFYIVALRDSHSELQSHVYVQHNTTHS